MSQSEALEIASAKLPGYEMTSVSVPDAETKTSAYSVWLSPGSGIDPTAHAPWAGTTEVAVDRYSGLGRGHVGRPGPRGRPVGLGGLAVLRPCRLLHGRPAEDALDHPGLTPLLLAVTGITTWLMRRRKRRAKAVPA